MFKVYHQLEHSDCGLACVRMIARHYGKRVPIAELREMCDLSRLGVSVRDIVDCCSKTGMNAVGVKVAPDFLLKMPLPAILYWNQRHFVVLYKIKKNGGCFYVADPSRGKTKYKGEEFCRYWIPSGSDRGLAVLAEPGPEFDDIRFDERNPLLRFGRYLSSHFKLHGFSFAIIAFLAVVLMAADLSVPLLLRKTIDEGVVLRDVGLIWILLLSQLAISLGGVVSSLSMDMILTKLGLAVNLEMVKSFLSRLVSFPVSFFERKVSSDFIQKIGDQSRIKDFMLSFPLTVLTAAVSLVVFSILLWRYSPLIFCVFFLLSVVEILWSVLFLSRRKALDYSVFRYSSENRNHAYEITNGMAELKANNAEETRVDKWKDSQEKLNSASMKSAWLDLVDSGGKKVMSKIKDLSVTAISVFMVVEGEMTIGVMMTLGYITGRLGAPFKSISDTVNSVQHALLAYERIEDVIDGSPEKKSAGCFSEASISLSDVWFKYPGSSSPYVIKGLTLEIEKGKLTAFVGESGCGKSTLIKLMLGFYKPQKGIVYLGGVAAEDMDNADWLSHCGVVMQSGHIFTGSILENISLSEPEPDLAKSWEMLDLVGLRDFVNTLPMGIHTRLGVSGIELSGGQKQRLMIARAIYKNPDILFLDEATSSLDANNERSIVEKIMDFGKGKTLIVAAHRLSTVRDADKIVFIKDGKIAEQGTHDELLAIRGYYWKLVKNQLQLSV